MTSLLQKALGLGGEDGVDRNETNGQEPVSGLMGQGTASSPYDMGNDEEASRLAVAEEDPSLSPNKSQEIGQGQYAKALLSQANGATTSENPQDRAVPSGQETASSVQASQPPAIGSPDWFQTALPPNARKANPLLKDVQSPSTATSHDPSSSMDNPVPISDGEKRSLGTGLVTSNSPTAAKPMQADNQSSATSPPSHSSRSSHGVGEKLHGLKKKLGEKLSHHGSKE